MNLETNLIKLFRSEYLCPISAKIMKNPLMDVDGVSYEAQQIQNWLKTNNHSYVTKLELQSKNLIPNHYLKDLIRRTQIQVPKIVVFIDSLKLKISELIIQNEKLQKELKLKSEYSEQPDLQPENNQGRKRSERITNIKKKLIKKKRIELNYNNEMTKHLNKERKVWERQKKCMEIEFDQIKNQLNTKILRKYQQIGKLSQQLEHKEKQLIEQRESNKKFEQKVVGIINDLREEIEVLMAKNKSKSTRTVSEQLVQQMSQLKIEREQLLRKIAELQQQRILKKSVQKEMIDQRSQHQSKQIEQGHQKDFEPPSIDSLRQIYIRVTSKCQFKFVQSDENKQLLDEIFQAFMQELIPAFKFLDQLKQELHQVIKQNQSHKNMYKFQNAPKNENSSQELHQIPIKLPKDQHQSMVPEQQISGYFNNQIQNYQMTQECLLYRISKLQQKIESLETENSNLKNLQNQMNGKKQKEICNPSKISQQIKKLQSQNEDLKNKNDQLKQQNQYLKKITSKEYENKLEKSNSYLLEKLKNTHLTLMYVINTYEKAFQSTSSISDIKQRYKKLRQIISSSISMLKNPPEQYKSKLTQLFDIYNFIKTLCQISMDEDPCDFIETYQFDEVGKEFNYGYSIDIYFLLCFPQKKKKNNFLWKDIKIIHGEGNMVRNNDWKDLNKLSKYLLSVTEIHLQNNFITQVTMKDLQLWKNATLIDLNRNPLSVQSKIEIGEFKKLHRNINVRYGDIN